MNRRGRDSEVTQLNRSALLHAHKRITIKQLYTRREAVPSGGPNGVGTTPKYAEIWPLKDLLNFGSASRQAIEPNMSLVVTPSSL